MRTETTVGKTLKIYEGKFWGKGTTPLDRKFEYRLCWARDDAGARYHFTKNTNKRLMEIRT